MANWKQGGTGKGDKLIPGTDLSNLDNVNFESKKSCSNCKSWKCGYDMFDNAICKTGHKYNPNRDTHECEGWLK
jgi:hypothetical protein